MTLSLRQRMNDIELVPIVAELFHDKWLQNAFMNTKQLINFFFQTDMMLIFPYATVRSFVLQALSHPSIENFKNENERDLFNPFDLALEKVKNVLSENIFYSKRIVKAVIDPIFEFFYEKILSNELMYLEMTTEQIKNITYIIDIAKNFMEQTLYYNQKFSLVRIDKLLRKRSYEPKGMALTLMRQLFDCNIIWPEAFRDWINDMIYTDETPALVELITHFIPLITPLMDLET